MNQEQIHDALNLLDDDMIEAVDALRGKESLHSKLFWKRSFSQDKKSEKIPWMKYMSLAACMCIVILGVYALKQFNIFRDNSVTKDEASRIETNSTENILDGMDAVDEEKDMAGNDLVEETNSDKPISESVIVGEVPSVLVRIDTWKESGFAGTVAGIVDTEIFEVGAEIRVIFKDNICLGVPTENGMTFEAGAPNSENFPVGSIVRVQFTIAYNDETDGSTTDNIEDEYVIYAELIAPADAEKIEGGK